MAGAARLKTDAQRSEEALRRGRWEPESGVGCRHWNGGREVRVPSPPTVTPRRKRSVGPEGDRGSRVALWATRTRQWPAADRTLTRRRERRRHSLVCGALPPPSTRHRATRPHPGGHARTVLSGRSARQPRTDADREAGRVSRDSAVAAASLSAPRWPHAAPPVRGMFP